MSKFFDRIFPKNKEYKDLEEPVQMLLNKSLFEAILTAIAGVILIFKVNGWEMKLFVFFGAVVLICTCFHKWYLFITDSVCSLEGVCDGTNFKESDNFLEKKFQKHFTPKVYVVKDGVRVVVNLKKRDFEVKKGDMVKFYTTPNAIIENGNGTVSVGNCLCFFITRSKESSEEEYEDDFEDDFEE